MLERKCEHFIFPGGAGVAEGCQAATGSSGREGHGIIGDLPLAGLSDLDRDVIRYLATRLSEAEIAAELGQPVLTIHRSIRRILRSAGTNNLAS